MKTFESGESVEHIDISQSRCMEIWTNKDGSLKSVEFLKRSKRDGAWEKDWSRTGTFHAVEAALFAEIVRLRNETKGLRDELKRKGKVAREFSEAHSLELATYGTGAAYGTGVDDFKKFVTDYPIATVDPTAEEQAQAGGFAPDDHT